MVMPNSPVCALDPTTPIFGYQIVQEFPHDPSAFTQGLIYEGGDLYEGTGLNGRSGLRYVDLETGTVLDSTPLDATYFGEGITLFNDKIYQLTWQNQKGFIYDKATLDQVGTFSYTTEGWGLTHDGSRLILSDGTPTIYFLDPQTLAVTGQISVNDNGKPLNRLNELEYIDGFIYANIWMTDCIARIDPTTGLVASYIDLSGLLATPPTDSNAVLNGIAYDAANDRFLVTGKLWPTLFEVDLIPPSVSQTKVRLPYIVASTATRP